MVSRMEAYPELKQRARVFIRVGSRRWDVKFDTGVVVKLPEFGVGDALAHLQTMQSEQDVLGKDIASLDLRLDDRVIVRLNEAAETQRQADLKSKLGKRT